MMGEWAQVRGQRGELWWRCLLDRRGKRGLLNSPWGTDSAKSSGHEESSASLGDYCVAEVMPSGERAFQEMQLACSASGKFK